MCIGENSAPHAEHYINGQLGTLWENAYECVQHHGKGMKPSESQKYSFALAEYWFGKYRGKGSVSKADMMFRASFSKPRIEFICNHDAIIHLSLNEGHYNSETSRVVDSRVTANLEYNREFKTVHASFRVPFRKATLDTRDKAGNVIIGNGNNVISLYLFDFQSARPVEIKTDADIDRQALGFYLLRYLRFLSNAGHHILFSLPDFDDDQLSVTIDFSAVSTTNVPVTEIHGVTVDKINAFLSTGWLKAAMLGSSPETSSDIKVALAEYRSTASSVGVSDVFFHAKLGAPRVKALCEQEVILYFSIDYLYIYETEDFNVKPAFELSDWEIALLVDVDTVVTEEGNATRCILKFDTARYVREYCSFPGLDEKNEDVVRAWTRVVNFFTKEYLQILEQAEYHVIYHYDIRWPKPAAIPSIDNIGIGGRGIEVDIDSSEIETQIIDSSWETTEVVDEATGTVTTTVVGSKEWQEVSETVDMGEFDQVTAISQSGIVAYFLSIWNSARTSKEKSLFKWSFEDYFDATFKPITLRLLSNGRAIVWIHLAKGSLKTLKDWKVSKDGSKYDFEDWSLAFEVDLKMRKHTEFTSMSSWWTTKFEGSQAYKEHGQQTDRDLQHIYLDFASAEFIHEFSSFEGLFQSKERRPIDYVQAMVTYLKEYYFKQITSSGYHILNTIPIWRPGSKPPSWGLTGIDFRIHGKQIIDRYNWGSISASDEPAIAIVGVTNFRPFPKLPLKGVAWTTSGGKGVSYGTVSISSETFVKKQILPLLASVNARTTVVPCCACSDANGAWSLKLTPWGSADARKARATEWIPDGVDATGMKYKWNQIDEWSYRHDGADKGYSGTYTAACETRNSLVIPTKFNGNSLEIKLTGDISIRTDYKGVVGAYSTKSGVQWSTALAIKSSAGGLKVEVVESSAPSFIKAEGLDENVLKVLPDLEAILKTQFPKTVELTEAVGEFKTFEGSWHSCYASLSSYELTQPIFNSKGDILFKLRPHNVVPSFFSKAVTATTSAVSSLTSAATSAVSSSSRTSSSSLIKSRVSLAGTSSRSSFLDNIKAIVSPGTYNGSAKSDASSTLAASSEDDGSVTEKEIV
ncbi:hypothetical protein EIP91_004681 [Steccherinum ochraceum]|uniref:Uncharacterized protein n=1 Tax=Steccherinum ochraceum TaxID=92696 RepID=A0A4R0RBG7_9APHY|nr:hypothetical protein EIP91_004681 [Steccherinum ochraceum]